MNSHMSLQITLCGESSAANLALERSFSSMDPVNEITVKILVFFSFQTHFKLSTSIERK